MDKGTLKLYKSIINDSFLLHEKFDFRTDYEIMENKLMKKNLKKSKK